MEQENINLEGVFQTVDETTHHGKIYPKENFIKQTEKLSINSISPDALISTSMNGDDAKRIVKQAKEDSTRRNMDGGDSRTTRRMYLKYATDYFKMKKRLSLNQWGELIRSNIAKGKEKHQLLVDATNKKQIEFLIDRETKYRDLLKSLNTSSEEIEKQIEKWYDTVIKPGSPLMVK